MRTIIANKVVLTIGTSARHGDRVPKVRQGSIGLDSRVSQRRLCEKRQFTERRSSFTFLRSKCIGAASKRILPDFKAAIEFEIS